MKRYLIDTCALIWYLEADKRMRPFKEEIEYYINDFAISIDSIKEFIYLVQSGKIKMQIDADKLAQVLNKGNITILKFDEYEVDCLFKLPFYEIHTDPTDRNIIATAIATNRTLISGDTHFYHYEKSGLRFVKI
ncbi:MAG: PIN domain-containing protein [Bacteroidales bacterium]|jgi:PIN domain nuclease of toxin-antitoxin system|nr:PIN domain-containing protein [Bacteroidales bacterium]